MIKIYSVYATKKCEVHLSVLMILNQNYLKYTVLIYYTVVSDNKTLVLQKI